eukprot:936441-Prymnesium_polylepis.1
MRVSAAPDACQSLVDLECLSKLDDAFSSVGAPHFAIHKEEATECIAAQTDHKASRLRQRALT